MLLDTECLWQNMPNACSKACWSNFILIKMCVSGQTGLMAEVVWDKSNKRVTLIAKLQDWAGALTTQTAGHGKTTARPSYDPRELNIT